MTIVVANWKSQYDLNTENTKTVGTTYVLIDDSFNESITISDDYTGSYIISFEGREAAFESVKIYKNGVAFGTARALTKTYVTYSQTFTTALSNGDVISLYGVTGFGTNVVTCRNFNIRFELPGNIPVPTSITKTYASQYIYDTENSTTERSYQLVSNETHTITTSYQGSYTITFKAHESTIGFARLYKNGVAWGTARALTTGYVAYKQDFTDNLDINDEISVYGYDTVDTTYVKDFRIRFDNTADIPPDKEIYADDTVQYSYDTENMLDEVDELAWLLVPNEILILTNGYIGSIRIAYDAKEGAGDYGLSKLFVNDAAYGTQQTLTTTYTTYSEDFVAIDLNYHDEITVYGLSDHIAVTSDVYVKNFRIKFLKAGVKLGWLTA